MARQATHRALVQQHADTGIGPYVLLADSPPSTLDPEAIMRTEDLACFLSVAQHRNMTVVAEELKCGQSTVSERIARLKHYLGERVIERRSDGSVILTAAGERLLPYAREIVSLAHELKQQRAAPQRARIGVNESVAYIWLGDWLSQLRTEQPDLVFDLKVGTTDELGALMLQGALDFAIGTRGFEGKRITDKKLEDLEMVFVGQTARHREAHYTLSALAAEGLISFQTGAKPYEDLWLQLTAAGLEHTRVDAISSVAVMLELVSCGGGIATLPRILVERAKNPSLRILPCDTPLKPLAFWLSWRTKSVGRDLPPALLSLTAFLECGPGPTSQLRTKTLAP